jgi:hypothetical protein
VPSVECTSDKPFYFSVAVPEGNYRITINSATSRSRLRQSLRPSSAVYAESVDTKPGSFRDSKFHRQRPHTAISTGGEVKLKDRERTSEQWAWDEKTHARVQRAAPVDQLTRNRKGKCPDGFLLGDSTVCDQPGEPYASWGQMITRFFGDKVAVANHAESGESLKSSLGAKASRQSSKSDASEATIF